MHTPAARPKVALVLSGGGARGIAHIGVLKVLENLRVPVDCIAGTSMGGLVGGIYASGMPLAEMEEKVRAIDWAHMFNDRPDRQLLAQRRRHDEGGYFASPEFGQRGNRIIVPGGVLYGQNMSLLFSRLASRARDVDDFRRLPTPFLAMATDIETGAAVVLDRGDLATAMRATMSIPGVMAPAMVNGRPLVDGMLVSNLPVAQARALCGDVVIAVNLGTPLLKRADIGSALTVGVQVVGILTESNVQTSLQKLRPGDILIEPRLGDIDAGSFDRVDELVAVGTAAASSATPELKRLALGEVEYAAWRAARERPLPRERIFDAIRVTPQRWVNADALQDGTSGAAAGYRESVVVELAERMYRRGDFERVQVVASRDGDKSVALIDAQEKSWGPNYLRFGLSMSAQSGESTYFNAVVSHRRTWLNSLGAEWRNVLQLGQHSVFMSELIQPLAVESSFFLAPRLMVSSEEMPVYQGAAQAGRISQRTELAGADIGFAIGHRGDLRAGVQWARETSKDNVGGQIGESISESARAWTLRGDYDQLDSLHFPTQGQRLRFERIDASDRPKLPYTRTSASGTVVDGWRNSALSLTLMRAHVEGSAPLADRIAMGGFQQLSGYPAGRFRADDVRFARVGYQRIIRPPLGLKLGGIVRQFYAGGSLEGARMEQSFDAETDNGTYRSASLFIGADTFLGPVFLAIGKGGHEPLTLWLSIGVPWTPQ